MSTHGVKMKLKSLDYLESESLLWLEILLIPDRSQKSNLTSSVYFRCLDVVLWSYDVNLASSPPGHALVGSSIIHIVTRVNKLLFKNTQSLTSTQGIPSSEAPAISNHTIRLYKFAAYLS